MDPATIRLLAQAERERRRRQRLAGFPRFGPWLKTASPELMWDWAWQTFVQREVYDRITDGLLSKAIIMAPPRHGKSELGTIRYPVYRIERQPTDRIIVGAYGQRLAEKFSRRSRKLAVARGLTLSRHRNTAAEWETEQGGGMRAVGVGGSITGMGSDGIFIDDPVKSRKEAKSLVKRDEAWGWYTDDLYTRREPRAWVVLQMTRWDEDDLAGRILASEDGPNWLVIRLPALAEADDILGRGLGEALCPERYDVAALLDLEKILRLSFAALFQQRPTAAEGEFFKRAWFKILEASVFKPMARVRHWDKAATEGGGDWTVGVRMARLADGMYVVEDVVRGQWAPTERDAVIRKTAEADPEGTWQHGEQEPGSAGVSDAKAFCRLLEGFRVSTTPASSEGSKELRAEAYASQCGADNVRLLRGKWNPGFVAEHAEFPNGKHDDIVDASAGAFNRLNTKRQSRAA